MIYDLIIHVTLERVAIKIEMNTINTLYRVENRRKQKESLSKYGLNLSQKRYVNLNIILNKSYQSHMLLNPFNQMISKIYLFGVPIWWND